MGVVMKSPLFASKCWSFKHSDADVGDFLIPSLAHGNAIEHTLHTLKERSML
jgi:hypothetical protein